MMEQHYYTCCLIVLTQIKKYILIWWSKDWTLMLWMIMYVHYQMPNIWVKKGTHCRQSPLCGALCAPLIAKKYVLCEQKQTLVAPPKSGTLELLATIQSKQLPTFFAKLGDYHEEPTGVWNWTVHCYKNNAPSAHVRRTAHPVLIKWHCALFMVVSNKCAAGLGGSS